MTPTLYDWIIYSVTFLILLSVLLEGKRTRHPALFFYGSLVLLLLLVVVGALNWWVYGSSFGAVIVIFCLITLLFTRFRLVIYAIRFKKLVSDIKGKVKNGFRIILVLPENDEEKAVLLLKLRDALPDSSLIYAPSALGPASGPLLSILALHHQKSTGYLLACEGQIQARTWLNYVENGDPDTSIAVNFHSIPDME